MTDIVEKLSKYVAGMGIRNPKDYTAFLTVEDAAEAIETIERLRKDNEELKSKLSKQSWIESPDRSGGQFTQEEINDHTTLWR